MNMDKVNDKGAELSVAEFSEMMNNETNKLQRQNMMLSFKESALKKYYNRLANSVNPCRCCISRNAAVIALTKNDKEQVSLQNSLERIKQKDLKNAIDSIPSIYPAGIPALALAGSEIYKQEYWTGDKDHNNNKMTIEDYVSVKQKPEAMYLPNIVYFKQASNFDMSEEHLEDEESNLPGQLSPMSSSAYDASFQQCFLDNIIYAKKLVKNEIQSQSAAMYGWDYEKEQLESFLKQYALKRMTNALVGSEKRPGLLKLGNIKIQLGTTEAQALLGGFAGTSLNADLSTEDYTKIGNGLWSITCGRGIVENNVSWDEPIMIVSPRAYDKMVKTQTLKIEGQNLSIGDNGLSILEHNSRSIQVKPLKFCSADNELNKTGKDLFIVADKAYIQQFEIKPLSIHGSWETADSMNWQVYYEAQYTRPFLKDNSRFMVFTAA